MGKAINGVVGEQSASRGALIANLLLPDWSVLAVTFRAAAGGLGGALGAAAVAH
jgi:hypothetical protein